MILLPIIFLQDSTFETRVLFHKVVTEFLDGSQFQVFKKSAVLFPKSYVDLNPMGLKVTLEQYNLSRRHAWFKSRLQSHFRDATEEIVRGRNRNVFFLTTKRSENVDTRSSCKLRLDLVLTTEVWTFATK